MAEFPSTNFSKETHTTVNVPPVDEAPVSRRGRRLLWTALTLLGVAFAAMSWYQIGLLQDLRASEGQRAETQNSQWLTDAAGLRDRISVAERTIATTLPENLKQFGARLGSFDQRLNAGLEKARKTTQDVAAALRGEMRASVETQKLQTEAKFRELETQRQAEADRAALLERNVADLNQKLAAVTTDLTQVEASVKRTQQDASKDTVELRRELQRTGDRVSQVANFQNRPRDRFEVRPGKTQEIAPGILLHISKVDPRFRRFHGWLQLIDDGKILWLKDQSMLQSVSFYAGKTALRHDIVVTDMSKPSVAGYLIYPATGESAGRQIASAN